MTRTWADEPGSIGVCSVLEELVGAYKDTIWFDVPISRGGQAKGNGLPAASRPIREKLDSMGWCRKSSFALIAVYSLFVDIKRR